MKTSEKDTGLPRPTLCTVKEQEVTTEGVYRLPHAIYVLVKLASVRLSTNCITMLAVASWYWDYVLDIQYNISRAASSKSPSGQRIARASFYVFCEGRTEL